MVADRDPLGQGVRVSDRLDEPTWRAFVEAQPDANIFHTPEMYRVFQLTGHHRPSVWVALDASGAPLALLPPVEINVLKGVLRPWASRAVAYGGLLCADDSSAERAVSLLLSAYARAARRQAVLTELRHVSDPAALRAPLEAAGFDHEEHLNYLIRLDRPEADLWAALSKTARQRIRSARKKGVVVEQVVDVSTSTGAYALLENVYRRVHVPLADGSLFRAALSVLGPRGMFRIFVARLGRQVIAARFLLLYGQRVLDWYAGSDRAFGSYSPNELLVWHVLRWARECGFELFDFGGAGRPEERYGPRDFKAKFGGELVNFGRDVLVHGPVRLRLSQAGYTVARRALWNGRPAARGARV